MGDTSNPILVKMLDRLVAGLLTGPNLNCRPHHSRQRVDLALLANFQDISTTEVLRELLGPARKAVVCAKAPPPKTRSSVIRTTPEEAALQEATDMSPEERRLLLNWQAQQSLLTKLRVLIDDARTYEQDTGVPVLNLGYPLLSLPPGGNGKAGNKRRILAPLAFIPVTIAIRGTTHPQLEIACRFEGADTVAPNPALLAWIERQTGKPANELFEDPDGSDPWREIQEVLAHVADWLGMPSIDTEGGDLLAALGDVQPTPRTEALEKGAEVIPAAVLGLFPVNNQGLLRDSQAMVAGEGLEGPVEAFIRAGVTLDQAVETSYEHEAWSGERRQRDFTQERLVTFADPCQCRATRLARTQRGLAIHGPPGTGKSQTITNIIGDHLSRGERVLMVCDKRTALDVVANRLEHLGLGELCALVHDPQHDQRDLYRQMREQLEGLADKKLKGDAARQIVKRDAELKSLHDELTEVSSLLMQPPNPDEPSFHELAGRWLSSPDTGIAEVDSALVRGIRLRELEPFRSPLDDLFTRAERVAFHENPWALCSGQTLDDFLGRPMQGMRDALAQCAEAARACDAASHLAIPPFCDGLELAAQAEARLKLAELLEHVLRHVDLESRQRWLAQDSERCTRARRHWLEAASWVELFSAGPLDAELALIIGAQAPTMPVLAQQLAALEEYLAVASKWYGLLFLRRSQRAGQVLRTYGLTGGPANAERLQTFLRGAKARLVLGDLHAQWSGQAAVENKLIPDEVLQRTIEQHPPVLELLSSVQENAALKGLAPLVAKALIDVPTGQQLLEGLRRSTGRAAALDRLRADLDSSRLFAASWIAKVLRQMSAGKSATKVIMQLQSQLASLEDVLRVRDAEKKLPAALQPVIKTLLKSGLSAEVCQTAVRKAVLHHEIGCRLEEQPVLRNLDAHRLERCYARYRECEASKRQQVRDAILQLWTEKQRQRLLAGTGTRLNSLGAEMKRRFTSRGEKAVRLRQAVALGQAIEGGDPLFDLKPVWLASPETVAQIFPRQPLFDVVIFDEASQCRLEEALPVLTRAKRVVIAGDPKQLAGA